jgi:hypothetical protein
MIAPDLIDEQPYTRPCRRCDIEINAASARCPYCGARQHRRPPILGWRGALVCLVAVAAAVLITRQIVEAHPSPASYTYYRGDNITALVPNGYQNLYLTSPHGTALAEFASGSQPLNAERVRATLPAHGTPSSRLAALAARLRNTRGAAIGYHSGVLLPGGLRIPSLYYTYAGVNYAVFAFDACNHTIAVTVTISTTTRGLLGEFSKVLPQSANVICDGPDFTPQDRADTSIPLALPS